MKNILFLVMIIPTILLFGCGEEKEAEPIAPVPEEVVNEVSDIEEAEEKEVRIDWEKEIDEIISSDLSNYGKIDRAYYLAEKYQPEKETVYSFFDDIVYEYGTGKHLTDQTNDKYMLTNYFKAMVVYKNTAKGTLDNDFSEPYGTNVEFAYKDAFDVQSKRMKENEEILSKLYKSATGKENSNQVEIEIQYRNPISELDENEVKAIIQEDVEAEWEGNYFMIERQIKRQTEAYEYLKALELDDVKEKVLQEAFNDWEYNFFMVERTYDRQMEAYNNVYN